MGFILNYANDDSRLTTEIIKRAHEFGTLITNYVKAIDFIYNDENKIIGVKAEARLTDQIFEIHASVVVNATGPWSDTVRKTIKRKYEEKNYFQQKVFTL